MYGERAFDELGSFCCYQHKIGSLPESGRTDKGVQCYQCKTCKKTCIETKGTIFLGGHHSPQTILDRLVMLTIAPTWPRFIAICGVKEETMRE